MGRYVVVILALLTLFASAGNATADVVILKDGRRFTGRVTTLSEKNVAIHAVIATIPAHLQFQIEQVLEVGMGPVPDDVLAVLEGRDRKPLTIQEEEAAREQRMLSMLRAVDARLQWIDLQLIETDARAQRLSTWANRYRSPGESDGSVSVNAMSQRRKDYLNRMRERYAEVRERVLESLGWGDIIS